MDITKVFLWLFIIIILVAFALSVRYLMYRLGVPLWLF